VASDTNLKQRVLSVLVVGESCSGDDNDNEERFSLSGAAHDLSARASGRHPRR
jgi:hypothetical protein